MARQSNTFICDVCSSEFFRVTDALAHESIPVTGEGLPDGFVFKKDNDIYAIRREGSTILGHIDNEHRAVYAGWVLRDVDDLDYYTNDDYIKIPDDIASCLLSDEEFRQAKERFTTARRTSCTEIDLEKLTNKLPEGYEHKVVKRIVPKQEPEAGYTEFYLSADPPHTEGRIYVEIWEVKVAEPSMNFDEFDERSVVNREKRTYWSKPFYPCLEFLGIAEALNFMIDSYWSKGECLTLTKRFARDNPKPISDAENTLMLKVLSTYKQLYDSNKS